MSDIIDRSEELLAIKRQFKDDYFRNEEAHKLAAELWGVECNPHGVAKVTSSEVLVDTGRCSGEMSLARTRDGYFLLGLDAMGPMGGFSYAPSVWDTRALISMRQARCHAITELILYFRGHSIAGQKAVNALLEARTPQLDLF